MLKPNEKICLNLHNIKVNGRRTSVRLETSMWDAFQDIAARENCSVHDIATVIAHRKSPAITLTTAIRVFTLLYYKAAATEEGHQRVGHGNLLKNE